MPKRKNGEGTIYQRPDGLWRGELTIGYDDNGKRIKKVFHSKELDKLQKKLNDEKYKLDRNIIVQPSDYTVSEWVLFWLENYKMNTLKSKTYDNYEYALNKHINGSIGNFKLNKVRTETIQQLYNKMHKKNLSSSTIRIVHVTLSQAFDQAIKNEILHTNPCKATIRPKKEKKKVIAMTDQQQDVFIKGCKGTTYHNFFVFLLNTGIRMGEALSLTWNDIDFEEGIISINKTASYIINRDDNSNTKWKTIIDTAKTAHSIRAVPMNNTSKNILIEQKKRADQLVFTSQAGTMLMARNINRSLNDLLKSNDLPETISVHTLRHSFATRLLERGVNPKTVSDLLGHASVQITLDVYSHVMPQVKNDAVKLLD